MATIELHGTKFSVSFLPLKLLSRKDRARTEIAIKNEYMDYCDVTQNIALDDMEKWIFSMFRLLAGAYSTEYSLSFENAGFAVDLYPYMKNGKEVPRMERRKQDCVMAVRLLSRSSDKKTFLGGVYSFLLHRDEIQAFAREMWEEFFSVYEKQLKGRGRYRFVGVSPCGYKGCNYWYLDPTGTVQAGDYVWVRMGRHDTEQVVYVDSVRQFGEENAPYDPRKVKRVLDKADNVEKW